MVLIAAISSTNCGLTEAGVAGIGGNVRLDGVWVLFDCTISELSQLLDAGRMGVSAWDTEGVTENVSVSTWEFGGGVEVGVKIVLVSMEVASIEVASMAALTADGTASTPASTNGVATGVATGVAPTLAFMNVTSMIVVQLCDRVIRLSNGIVLYCVVYLFYL